MYPEFIKPRNAPGINLGAKVCSKVFYTTKDKPREKEEEYHCSVCGTEITKEDYDSYDGMCWECWDDQFTEESLDMFGDFM